MLYKQIEHCNKQEHCVGCWAVEYLYAAAQAKKKELAITG